MHELDLTKLVTGFVPCYTDIVVFYTDGANEGAGLHVESLSLCGVPRPVGSAALVFPATSSNLNTKGRIISTTDHTKRKNNRPRLAMHRSSLIVAPMKRSARLFRQFGLRQAGGSRPSEGGLPS